MKRMIMAFAAAMMMGSATMAQTNDSTKAGKPDRSEIIRKRTEAVALRYGLNDEQKAKLLDLNTRFDGRMRMGMAGRGDRRMNPVRREPVRKMNAKRDSAENRIPQKADGNRMMRKGPRMPMENGMQKYDEEMKTIMTEEQFARYKEDMKKRYERMGARKNMRRLDAGDTKIERIVKDNKE
jgi:hypothetical protein